MEVEGGCVMAGYEPPFSITPEMLSLVAVISEKVGAIRMADTMAHKPHLRRLNRIRSIHSSLRIEHNALSLDQVQDVIDGRMVVGDQKEIQEVKNAFAAYELLPSLDPFCLEDLLTCHGVMTAGVVPEAGRFRSGEEGVFDGEVCIFVAPPAKRVPQLMAELFAWLQTARMTLHPLILSAVFHYEFVFIHPFSDGNGRMARLWHTALLADWQPFFANLPLESQVEHFQEDYYQAIAQCHHAGKSDAFILFMLARIDTLLMNVLEQEADDGLPPRVKKLLDVMAVSNAYSAAALMEKLGLHNKDSFRKNYLQPAMALAVVEMTIPEKPRSRNQQYRRVEK